MGNHYEHDHPEAPEGSARGLRQIVAEQEATRRRLQDANQALEQQVAQRTARLRQMAAALTCAEQRERYRLAQLLDDNLRELLVSAKRAADALQACPHDQQQEEQLQQTGDLLDKSIQRLRSFTAQLSPPVLYEGTMSNVLQWLAAWMWKEHGFAVQIDADASANPQDEDVRIMLFHAVQELLRNVRKHAGTRNARITLARTGPDFIEITVADTGNGFDPAVKMGQARFAAGVSLATLRERLELLGGRMDIYSAPGEGTKVTLLAPTRLGVSLARAVFAPVPVGGTTAAAAPTHAAGADIGVHRIRILLADDHTVVRDSLAHLLESQPDMDVVAKAVNGLEAVDLALALQPDVIIMDVNMPLLNGIQATKRIVSQLSGARVIGLSMYSAADMDLAMRQAGASDYLTKDSAPEELLARIRKRGAQLARR
jgi:CheY-like chemotaxis protein/anti-sigma regulatory factor (Ser/Thr protein kinase)